MKTPGGETREVTQAAALAEVAQLRLMPAPRWALCFGLIFALLAFRGARAQETAPPQWEFYLDPYLWVSGVTGTTSTQDPDIPEQRSTASFGDLLSHLNRVPIIAAGEVRYGRLGILTDLMVISLAVGLPTKGPAFSGQNTTVTELLSTTMPTYRVLQLDDQTLDLGIGARVIALWTKVSVNAGKLPGFTRKTSISWADPLIGARYHFDFSPRWGATAYGDVGGFGAGSNFTWQALGLIDYRYSASTTIHLGWRYLDIDYRGSKLNSDTALSGPIVGATVRF